MTFFEGWKPTALSKAKVSVINLQYPNYFDSAQSEIPNIFENFTYSTTDLRKVFIKEKKMWINQIYENYNNVFTNFTKKLKMHFVLNAA